MDLQPCPLCLTPQLSEVFGSVQRESGNHLFKRISFQGCKGHLLLQVFLSDVDISGFEFSPQALPLVRVVVIGERFSDASEGAVDVDELAELDGQSLHLVVGPHLQSVSDYLHFRNGLGVLVFLPFRWGLVNNLCADLIDPGVEFCVVGKCLVLLFQPCCYLIEMSIIPFLPFFFVFLGNSRSVDWLVVQTSWGLRGLLCHDWLHFARLQGCHWWLVYP